MFEYERPQRNIDTSRFTPEVIERPVLEDQFLEEFIVNQATLLVGLGEDGLNPESQSASPDTFIPNEYGRSRGRDELNRFFRDPRYLPHINRMFETAMGHIGKAPVSFSPEKRERVARMIENNLSCVIGYYPHVADEAYFNATVVKRGFVSTPRDIEAMAVDSKPLAHTLFCVPKFVIGSSFEAIEGAERYITESVRGKRILLLGGGNSCEDLVYDNKNFSPEVIINVDPYRIRYEDKTETPNPYIRIDTTAEDLELGQKLESVGYPHVDEIWATFSVPFYSNKPEDITAMFENAKKLLAPGGMLRIYPFSLPDRSVNILDRASVEKAQEVLDMNEKLREAYEEAVREINNNPHFNVSIVRVDDDNKVLLIQKV